MFIQGLGSIQYQELKGRTAPELRDQKDLEKKPGFQVTDTYEPHNDPAERKELLQEVRKKIISGYYNKESVLEDLSYSFAKVMNQM
ncbi:MAG: hypothetical protein MZV70_77390 [Desulfobacterales bacterium]|nr:hypothetical protein [Desulfobacterales bacterium]